MARTTTQYIASGLQAAFETQFDVFAAADLEVYLGDVLMTDGFTLTGLGSRVTVTFGAAPASGTRVTLNRRTQVERETQFSESGAFSAGDLNRELQNIYHLIDEQVVALARAMLLPPSSAASAAPQLPSPVATGQRALLLLASGALGLSQADPDTYEARVSATEALAAASNTAAVQALATAAAALAATGNFVAAIQYGTVTLSEGVTEYTLLGPTDSAVATAGNFELHLGGAFLLPDQDYTLSADGKGIVLNTTVLAAGSTPGAGEVVEGDQLWWLKRIASLTELSIAPGSVGEPQLANNAIVLSGAKVAAGTAHRLLYRDAAGKLAELAYPAVGKVLGTTAENTLGEVALPAAAADADVQAKTGAGYVKSSQIPLITAGVLATLKIVNLTQAQATSGWSIARTGVGVYRVGFPASFASAHDYQVQIQIQNAVGARAAMITTLAVDHCIFETRTTGSSNLEDQPAVMVTILAAKV